MDGMGQKIQKENARVSSLSNAHTQLQSRWLNKKKTLEEYQSDIDAMLEKVQTLTKTCSVEHVVAIKAIREREDCEAQFENVSKLGAQLQLNEDEWMQKAIDAEHELDTIKARVAAIREVNDNAQDEINIMQSDVSRKVKDNATTTVTRWKERVQLIENELMRMKPIARQCIDSKNLIEKQMEVVMYVPDSFPIVFREISERFPRDFFTYHLSIHGHVIDRFVCVCVLD